MNHLLVFVFLATFGSTALASEPIDWADLIDQSAQTFDDPYRDLSYDDIGTLKTIVVAQKALEKETLTDEKRAELNTSRDDAKLRLLEGGIDADWLIAQRWVVAERREQAAAAGNPIVDGQVVALSGYAIPAPPDVDGTPIAYLVPERGMCSHTPPPNANQMIRVRLTDQWQPSFAHEPVRLTGRITISPTQEVFSIVDGPVQMNATFVMVAGSAQTLAGTSAQPERPETNDWANSIAQKLRASGALPAKAPEASQ